MHLLVYLQRQVVSPEPARAFLSHLCVQREHCPICVCCNRQWYYMTGCYRLCSETWEHGPLLILFLVVLLAKVWLLGTKLGGVRRGEIGSKTQLFVCELRNTVQTMAGQLVGFTGSQALS